MKRGYFENGGGRVFLSITNTRETPVSSVTSTWCWLIKDWGDAFIKATEWLHQHRQDADKIVMFTKPRLCAKCLRHASVPLVFDKAEHIEECLCFIEKTPCGVH